MIPQGNNLKKEKKKQRDDNQRSRNQRLQKEDKTGYKGKETST
jgi:hypothetical protein